MSPFDWVELVSKCGPQWNGNKIPVSHSNVFLRISSETVHPAKHPFHPSIHPFIMQTHLPKSGLYFLHDKPNMVLNVLSTSGFPGPGPKIELFHVGMGTRATPSPRVLVLVGGPVTGTSLKCWAIGWGENTSNHLRKRLNFENSSKTQHDIH